MRSGWLYRIGRCIQPKACELSFYHHGSAPPKTIKQILKNGDRDSLPKSLSITLRHQATNERRFVPGRFA